MIKNINRLQFGSKVRILTNTYGLSTTTGYVAKSLYHHTKSKGALDDDGDIWVRLTGSLDAVMFCFARHELAVIKYAPEKETKK